MPLQDDIRTQDAILWRATGVDPFGDPTYAAPEDIKVWWKDDVVEVLDANGTRTISNALVYVGEVLKPGDVLKRGTVADDIEPGVDPIEQTGAYPIRRFSEITGTGPFASMGSVRKAYL